MKTNIYQVIVLIFLSISFLTSCTEDSFTKIVDVDLAEEDKQLSVVARMNTTGEAQSILVSETLSVLEDSNNFSSLSDAKITITTPDAGDIQPSFDSEIDLYSLTNYTFKEGQEYSIEVDHPDYAPMTANIKVPSAPEIIDMNIQLTPNDTFPDGSISFFPKKDLITIKIKDPANESNSYLFNGNISFKDDTTGELIWGHYYFEISENILEYNDEVVSDITFNGKEYEIAMVGSRNIFVENATPYSFVLEVISISEELLLYENSIDQAFDSNDNPFVEPSTIYTNFDNGFGIFTVDVSQKIEIIF